MTHSRTLSILTLLLGLKLIAICFVIVYAGIGLGPDESQYWTWSRALDWGYYSKPPGIAWEIWLGTSLFGHTELGVRAVPLLIGTIFPLAVFAIAFAARLSSTACFWAALCAAFSPIGIMASFLAITDGGMLLFWTAALAYFIWKVTKNQVPHEGIIGLLICCGALFKWPIYFLWIFVLGWQLSQRQLHVNRFLGGVTLSLIALLPSVYWNAAHGWPTFKHVLSTLKGGHGASEVKRLIAGNPLEFLGSQVAILSPILFILLLLSLYSVCKNRFKVPKGIILSACIAFFALLMGMLASFLMKIQGNWVIFAYPTAFILIAWYATTPPLKKWLMGGVVFSLVMTALTLSIPTLLKHHQDKLSFTVPHPFKHNVGWQQLSLVLKEAGYNPAKDFLFGDKYQMASILSFYSEEQKRAYFFNLQGSRKNQFSFWPGMVKEKGNRGFFVIVDNAQVLNQSGIISEKYQQQLEPYFEQIHFLGVKPLFPAKGALIFECIGYLGNVPEDPELY